MKVVGGSAATALWCIALASQAHAQIARSPLLDGSVGQIREEVTKRYDAALAATRSRDIVAANDVRFTWASEAKVACGMAYGYLKTNYRDEDTLNKCECFHDRMVEYMH